MLFDFYNYDYSLTLDLWLWAGTGSEEIIERLLQLCMDNQQVFKKPTRQDKWWCVYKREFLVKDNYAKLNNEDLYKKISAVWSEFTKFDFPAILAAFKSADWLWQPQQPHS